MIYIHVWQELPLNKGLTTVVKEVGRCLVLFDVSCLLFSYLLLDHATCLSHASPSEVLHSLPINVCLLLRCRAESEEPLVLHTGRIRMRGTGKGRSYGHLNQIAPVVAHTNRPTFRTMASLSSPPMQYWSRWHHFMAASLTTGVLS